MEDVLGSNDGWTPQRYEAALTGGEYALLKRDGVMELGELYRPMNGTNGTNGHARLADAPTISVRSIDVCVDEGLPIP